MGRTGNTFWRDEKFIKKKIVGKPAGKRPPRRSRRRLENNIRMDLK
jgi:hypothetical protein